MIQKVRHADDVSASHCFVPEQQKQLQLLVFVRSPARELKRGFFLLMPGHVAGALIRGTDTLV
jgi:hypothetical protein